MSRILFPVLALIACESAAQDKTDFPKTAPPQFVMVASIDFAKDVLVLSSIETVPEVVIKEVSKFVGGRIIKEQVPVTVFKTVSVERPYTLKSFQPVDASGKILGWSQIKAGKMVLMAQSPSADPAYRGLLRPETVILLPRPPEVLKNKKS